MKTHKEHNSMCPMITLKRGPMENVGKWILQKLTSIISSRAKENSEDLVQVPENFNKNNMDEIILASLYVKSMYPFLPVNNVINVLEELLENKTNGEIIALPMNKEHFLKILNFYLNNIQVFNGKVLKQKQGLSIGAQTSPIL